MTSVPSFVQRACVTALNSDTSEIVEIFRRRRDYVYKRLTDMGLDVQEPEGAFYMFINIKRFGMDSLTFCRRMLKEGLVGVIPGIYFGTEGYMRLSYCYQRAICASPTATPTRIYRKGWTAFSALSARYKAVSPMSPLKGGHET